VDGEKVTSPVFLVVNAHMPFADRRGEEYIGQPLITQPVSTWRLETMTVQSDCNCTKVVNEEDIPCSKKRALRI
jgi:hypothetical protein